MAVYTEELNTNYNYPNINIYNRYRDGVLTGYNAYPVDGYVMYDTTDNYTEPLVDKNGDYVYDEEGNIIEVHVRYYYTVAGFPLRYNFNNFSYVAVLRSEVDEDYITGDPNEPEHEVM